MTISDTIAATIAPADAAAMRWHVAIIGAGPAGAALACALAQRGHRVMLIDRAVFPRDKVCGCCINGRAVAALDTLQLSHILRDHHAVETRRFDIRTARARAVLDLPPGFALSRRAFDAALVRSAIAAGAAFLPGFSASDAGPASRERRVLVHHHDVQATVRARVVIAADGLSGGFLRDAEQHHPTTNRRSYIGLGGVLDDAAVEYAPGTIFMHVAVHGYVGIVRLEDGRLDVAAALAPSFVRAHATPGQAVGEILRKSGGPTIARLESAAWRGTPLLTRRRKRITGERLLLIGDAAGYVEPFTGEGIAWALASACAAQPIVSNALAEGWSRAHARAWSRAHRRVVGRRQLACRLVTTGLRHPGLTGLAVRAIALAPSLAAPLIRAVTHATTQRRAIADRMGAT